MIALLIGFFLAGCFVGGCVVVALDWTFRDRHRTKARTVSFERRRL